MSTLFYTVCTLSHLYQAEILAKALRAVHPEAEFKVGLVDRLGPGLDLGSLTRDQIVEVGDMGISALGAMSARYRVSELCFACKPFVASFLLATRPDVDRLIYIDSDTFVFGRFESVQAAMAHSDIVLSPHLSAPLQEHVAIERLMLKAGAFNAGFFALRRGSAAQELLDWLMLRLESECFGWAGDQVWFSLIPSHFSGVYVDRNPGLNAAAWNAAERRMSRDGDVVSINSVPLVFYHYSGFDPTVPDRSSNVREFAVMRAERPDLWYALDPICAALRGSSLLYLRGRPSHFGRPAATPARLPGWVRLVRQVVRRTGFDIVRSGRAEKC
jgi:hypothetical protein